MPQNFSYTSRATELGRGVKKQKMDDLPEWTPGPGEYGLLTDFNKKTTVVRRAPVDNADFEPEDVTVPAWDQRGF